MRAERIDRVDGLARQIQREMREEARGLPVKEPAYGLVTRCSAAAAGIRDKLQKLREEDADGGE